MATPREGDAPLSDGELLQLLRVAGSAVLVGGQALAFWAAYFRVRLPPGPQIYLSRDADFLGFAHHVAAFAKAIGGRASYPGKRGFTVLAGVVTKQRATGARIGVDVLDKVVGLDAGTIRRHAIEVTHASDAAVRFKVMDPVSCLVSRIENLDRLEEKRNEVGAWQAEIAIRVGRAYLTHLIRSDNERAAIRGATRVWKLAGGASGLRAFADFRIDLLKAVPVARYASAGFRVEQSQRMVRQIRALRRKRRPFAAATGRSRPRERQ